MSQPTRTVFMRGHQVRDARDKLGKMWGLDRPLFMAELGRALRLQGRDPGATVKDWEDRDTISGPASGLLQAYLNGAKPVDGMDVVLGSRA